MSRSTEVCADYIHEMKPRQLLEYAPPLLQNENTKLQIAVLLAERLQSQTDDDDGVRAILRLLCTHCCGDAFILDVFVELLACLEKKEPIINSIAPLAMNASNEQIQQVLDQYRELIEDRTLLVPIIGSISELRLSQEQKENFFALVEEALTLVDHSDVPTMVQALLHLTTSSNVSAVMRKIRQESARVPVSIAAMLSEPIVAAMRTRTICSRAYWAEFESDFVLSPLDVFALSSLLQATKFRSQATSSLLQALHSDPAAIDVVSQTLASSTMGPAGLDFLYVALQPWHGSDKAARQSSRSRGRHSSAASTRTLRRYVCAVSSAIFAAHEPLRLPAVTALLCACSFRSHADASRRAALPSAAPRPSAADAVPRRSGAPVLATARNAAAALLHLAESSAAHMARCAELLVQFLAQHAASIDLQVLHLAAAAVARLIQGADPGPAGPAADGVAVTPCSGNGDSGGDADSRGRGEGVYGSALLLLQKLLMHPRGASQRAALVLSGHLLRSGRVRGRDRDLILGSFARLPFLPSWFLAPHLYTALAMAAGRGMPPAELAALLRRHLLPAAAACGLLQPADGAGEHGGAREEARGDVGREGVGAGGVRRREDGEEEGGCGGAAGEGRTLTLGECAERVLSGGAERAEAGWDGVCAELLAVVRLYESLLVAEGHCKGEGEEGVRRHAREACGWFVAMPPLLQEEEEGEEEGEGGASGEGGGAGAGRRAERVAQQLAAGLSCWLNFGVALAAVRLANGGRGGWRASTAEGVEERALCSGAEAKVVLGRLIQGMRSWHHLQHSTLPAVEAWAAEGGRQREEGADVEGVRALVAMGQEEGKQLPPLLLARFIGMLHPVPAGFLPAVLEMLRLLNAHLREGLVDGAESSSGRGAGGEGAEAGVAREAVWSAVAAWLTDKLLTLGLEAHSERKAGGAAGGGIEEWRAKGQVVGECYVALITLLAQGGGRCGAGGAHGSGAEVVLGREGVLSAMGRGCARARRTRGGGGAGAGGGGEGSEVGVLVRELLESSEALDDGRAACMHVELVRMVGAGTEWEGEAGRLGRRLVGRVFPVEGCVSAEVAEGVLEEGAGRGGGAGLGRQRGAGAGCEHVRRLMGVAMRLLPFREAVAMADGFLQAAGAPAQRKGRKRGVPEAEEVAWESLSGETVAEMLAPALELACAVCEARAMPQEAGAAVCVLEAVREGVMLLGRALRASEGASELLGSGEARAAVVKAAGRVFAMLRRKGAEMVGQAKMVLEPSELRWHAGLMLQQVSVAVETLSRVCAAWEGQRDWGKSKLREATPRSLLEGELLSQAVQQIAECYHLEARADPSVQFEMSEELRYMTVDAIISGRHSAAAQLTESEDSDSESEDEDEDDGFRVVRKRPRIEAGDKHSSQGNAEAAPAEADCDTVVINFAF